MNFAVEAVTDGVQAVYAVHTAAEEGRPYDLMYVLLLLPPSPTFTDQPPSLTRFAD